MGDMQHIGVDIVHVPGFREQLERPGSRFEDVFTALELRVAARKPDRVLHLAGRWGAEGAFIKAWGGRVGVEKRGAVAQAVADSIGDVATSLSISHDGDYAIATCLVYSKDSSDW